MFLMIFSIATAARIQLETRPTRALASPRRLLRMLDRVVLLSLFSFSIACGDSGSTTDAGGDGPAGGNGSGAQGSGAEGSGAAGSDGGNGAGEGGAAAALPVCVLSCSAAADCATASPLTDADNWTCSEERCVYLGCLSSAECQSAYANPAYVCDEGAFIPTCALSCNTPADCATGTPLTDADNWSCDVNLCVYLGCNSDGECQEAYANPAYTCDASLAIPGCFLDCASSADCATAGALTDADNWACNDHCEYLGCQSTTECQQVLANQAYVCE